MLKLTSKQADIISDVLNTACEGYLEQIEAYEEEQERLEAVVTNNKAIYEEFGAAPQISEELAKLEELAKVIARLNELNDQTLNAIELLRVAEFGE